MLLSNESTEPLLDCLWTNAQFHCLKQNGFECQTPVSDIAVISMPNNFTDKRGNYRCVPFGYNHTMARPCLYPEVEGKCHYFVFDMCLIKNQKQVFTPYNGNEDTTDP